MLCDEFLPELQLLCISEDVDIPEFLGDGVKANTSDTKTEDKCESYREAVFSHNWERH